MGILTEDMKRLVDEQQLGFHATVCPDGSPNLSPKGSTRVWDDDHLFFADVCSPQTTANIRAGSLIEVNVVDPFVRKGYRFKGRAVVHEPGSFGFVEGIERMRAAGIDRTGQAIVVIEVQHAAPLCRRPTTTGRRRKQTCSRLTGPGSRACTSSAPAVSRARQARRSWQREAAAGRLTTASSSVTLSYDNR